MGTTICFPVFKVTFSHMSAYWLRASKLCLYVQETELIIFSPTSLKRGSSIKFKLETRKTTYTNPTELIVMVTNLLNITAF